MAANQLQVPVVLFAFNRPALTELSLRRIIEANPRRIYFVQDGPRPGNLVDQSLVIQVRELLSTIPDNISVIQILAEENLGLRTRFLSALDQIFELENSAVIIEDDCLVELSFFSFAERCLEFYADHSSVGTVSAHRPISIPGGSKVVFDEVTRIWGWATWADRWKAFRSSPPVDIQDETVRRYILSRVRSRTWRFMAQQIFTHQSASENWDVSLALYSLGADLLSVSPAKNAMRNLGSRNGTHPQEWAFLEMPKTRPVSGEIELTPPIQRSMPHVWWEDAVRAMRWLFAAVKSPHLALEKLRSLRL